MWHVFPVHSAKVCISSVATRRCMIRGENNATKSLMSFSDGDSSDLEMHLLRVAGYRKLFSVPDVIFNIQGQQSFNLR
jgi:hypothetical protein